jgi:hypothetical protein
MIMLNPIKVPPEIVPVLPFAEQWGVSDDYEREAAIENATTEELNKLAHCLDQVDDGVLTSWLTGPESREQTPTDEYLAVTCLTMAVHSAKVKLKKRRQKPLS